MRAQSGCRWCGDLCCVLIGQNRVTWYDCSSSQYMQDNIVFFFLTRIILTVKRVFIFWARQWFLHCGHNQVLDSLVVRISACHVEGPGSIPGRGDTFFLSENGAIPAQRGYHGLWRISSETRRVHNTPKYTSFSQPTWIYWSYCTCFGSTYTKIGTIQRRLAWPLRKDDTQNREAFHIFGAALVNSIWFSLIFFAIRIAILEQSIEICFTKQSSTAVFVRK